MPIRFSRPWFYQGTFSSATLHVSRTGSLQIEVFAPQYWHLSTHFAAFTSHTKLCPSVHLNAIWYASQCSWTRLQSKLLIPKYLYLLMRWWRINGYQEGPRGGLCRVWDTSKKGLYLRSAKRSSYVLVLNTAVWSGSSNSANRCGGMSVWWFPHCNPSWYHHIWHYWGFCQCHPIHSVSLWACCK